MNQTKENELVYSGERVETTRVESPSETTKPPESSRTEYTGQFSKQTQATQAVAWPQMTRAGRHSPLEGFTKFLQRTKQVWLIAAGTIFGLMAGVTLVTRASEWARNEREKRHDHAVATVTPDTLIARCSQPAADVTWEVYPILMRTMTYLPGSNENERVVITFSRTAEEKSDWVFLSMKDETGAKSYDTPETKIAALPCLDLK